MIAFDYLTRIFPTQATYMGSLKKHLKSSPGRPNDATAGLSDVVRLPRKPARGRAGSLLPKSPVRPTTIGRVTLNNQRLASWTYGQGWAMTPGVFLSEDLSGLQAQQQIGPRHCQTHPLKNLASEWL
jgi:hypothetical protein